MNIQKYEIFLRIVELGSLTKTAEVLGTTQSAMSQILNSLEKEWGVSLLIRDRTGVRPTAEAEKLVPLMRHVCEGNRLLEGEVVELRGLKSGLIKIATITSLAQHRLPQMIQKFKALYPSINFQLHYGAFYSDVENMVSDGIADIGFTTLPATKPDFESIFLERDELVAVLPQNHPLAAETACPLERLTEFNFILPAEEAEKDLYDYLQQNGITPNAEYTCWDTSAIISMVECGLGISVLPELLLHRTPYNVVRKSLETPHYRQLGVVVRDRVRASKATRCFLDCMENADR